MKREVKFGKSVCGFMNDVVACVIDELADGGYWWNQYYLKDEREVESLKKCKLENLQFENGKWIYESLDDDNKVYFDSR